MDQTNKEEAANLQKENLTISTSEVTDSDQESKEVPGDDPNPTTSSN
jgi:beta-lactam-binding protein with PASTA domain